MNQIIMVAHLAVLVKSIGTMAQLVFHSPLLNKSHSIDPTSVMEHVRVDSVHQTISHAMVSIHTEEQRSDGINLILDINECNLNSSLCGNGTCINLIGSYTCNCTSGFRFNGQTCIGNLNSLKERNSCSHFASCIQISTNVQSRTWMIPFQLAVLLAKFA